MGLGYIGIGTQLYWVKVMVMIMVSVMVKVMIMVSVRVKVMAMVSVRV